ncbi:M1 family aminopeptidase [Metallosphaera javensis (ex Sakai et al. 2022)]|uniref:M1 family aminopeptidase n=1 Tax=Metallosphaera javensis (ex Sakai et al. 2022) TaxID=2775498 RepID=UPI002585478F|nr:MAG: aminopeptidase [Metallosphaera javensis (ex Sakai et al. 2022)]
MSYVPTRETEQVRLGKGYILKEHEKHYPENYPCTINSATYFLKVDHDRLEGKASLSMECRKGQMTLSGRHFTVREFSVNGRGEYHYDGNLFRFDVDSGPNNVTISYVVSLMGSVQKLEEMNEISTTGETENPVYWIPSLPEPGIKTKMELYVQVRKPLMAISNGELKEVKDLGDMVEYHWVMDFPHSFYLTSLAVGQFSTFREQVDGVTLEYYLPKGFEDYLWNLESTKRAMKFFSSYTGIPYPYRRYAQVILFGMNGGMEYISSTHLTWRILHDRKADEEYSADSLIAHELAHQWFGDLVTTKDWPNIWLNEGFATYFQALFTEYDKGKEEFLYDMYTKMKTYLEETEEYTRPIVSRYYRWPDELFDRHTYQKGALVLHALRNMLGDEIFREGIRTYLEQHAGKAVDTEDFRKAMEKVSGQDLSQFFDLYVYSAGHPEITVSIQYSNTPVIVLEQAEPGYPLEIEVKIVSNSGSEIRKIKLNSRSEIPVPGLKYACVDPEFKAFVVVNDNQPEEMLISETGDPSIMCRIRSARGLSKYTDERAVRALGKLLYDTFWGVAYEAALSLGKMKTQEALSELSSHKISNPKARRGVAKALAEFKYEERASDLAVSMLRAEENYYVKAELVRSLGKIGLQKYQEEVKKYYAEESHLDVIRSAVLEALAYFGSQENYNFILEKAFKGESFPVRESATRWLGKFGERAVDPLSALVRDRLPRVRSSAVEALADTSSLKAIPVLQSVVKNEDEDGRIRALALRKTYSLGKTQSR